MTKRLSKTWADAWGTDDRREPIPGAPDLALEVLDDDEYEALRELAERAGGLDSAVIVVDDA